MRQIWIAVVFCLILAGFSLPAGAQKVLESFRVALPEVPALSDADFEAQTDLYQSVPFGEKALAFTMRVPKDWSNTVRTDDQAALSKKVIGEMARFYSPGRISARSYISVQAFALDYDMSAEHWVLRYLLSNGLTSKGMDTKARDEAEFFHIEVEKDVSYAVRSRLKMNGKRAILVQYYLPFEMWEQEMAMQARIVDSFKIQTPLKEDVELMTEYRFLDIARIKYPESWALKAPPVRSTDHMEVRLLYLNRPGPDVKPSVEGKIDIDLDHESQIESVEARVKEIVAKGAQDSSFLVEEIDSKAERLDKVLVKDGGDPGSYDLAVYGVRKNEESPVSYELWVTSVRAGEYYYFFTLLTPPRDEDFFVWSRNKEAYDLVLQTLDRDFEGAAPESYPE